MGTKTEYSYSVGRAEFALLNADKSFPTLCDWDDTHPITGATRTHKGGLVGKAGVFNISGWSGKDLSLTVRTGTVIETFPFVSTATNKDAVTVAEFVKDFNTAFAALASKKVHLTASATSVGSDYDAVYLKIEKSKPSTLPWFAPVSFSGRLAELLGITGWRSTAETKSVKDDFDKESGKSVDATSGHGIRCSIKEPDTVKGVNLSISLAGMENKIISLISGNTYNEAKDEFYFDNKKEPPLFAHRYFVKQFERGSNTKASNTKVRVVCFPSCQASLSGADASEDNFATQEISATGSENKPSNLPFKFHKGVSVTDFDLFVENE